MILNLSIDNLISPRLMLKSNVQFFGATETFPPFIKF